ncbi:MAG: hypothetical protein ACE5E6_11530, partial [Phycisphaerae bacterium]
MLSPTSPPPPASLVDVARVYWPILVISFCVALVATPLCRRVALRRGIVDRPDEWLKPHGKSIAYLGGVAIFLGWGAGLVYALARYPAHTGPTGAAGVGPTVYWPWMIGILVAGAVIMLLGLADDLRVMTPRAKLVGNVL